MRRLLALTALVLVSLAPAAGASSAHGEEADGFLTALGFWLLASGAGTLIIARLMRGAK